MRAHYIVWLVDSYLWVTNIFCGFSFHSLIVFFEAQKFLIFVMFNLSIFTFVDSAFILHLKIYLKIHHYEYLPLCFFSKSFIYVFNPLWLNLYMWCELRVQCRTFTCGYPIVPVLFFEETILSPFNDLGNGHCGTMDNRIFVKINWS